MSPGCGFQVSIHPAWVQRVLWLWSSPRGGSKRSFIPRVHCSYATFWVITPTRINCIMRSISPRSIPVNLHVNFSHFFFLWRCDPKRVMASSSLRFLDHTRRRTTVGSTPLDEWSAHRRDLHLTTHNTHNRQISLPPVGFEPTIPAGERPADLRLRPRGHWDRHISKLQHL